MRGTQPVLLFGRIARRTFTHVPSVIVCWASRSRMFDVPSPVLVAIRVTTFAVAFGAERATVGSRTYAQCETLLSVSVVIGGGGGAATSTVTARGGAAVGGVASSVALNVIGGLSHLIRSRSPRHRRGPRVSILGGERCTVRPRRGDVHDRRRRRVRRSDGDRYRRSRSHGEHRSGCGRRRHPTDRRRRRGGRVCLCRHGQQRCHRHRR